jgi:hypothetical protein
VALADAKVAVARELVDVMETATVAAKVAAKAAAIAAAKRKTNENPARQ